MADNSKPQTPVHAVVMGVAGCGKSSVGEQVADALGISFLEGDSLHPASNIEKMSNGIALNDEDRWPWLETIAKRIADAPAGLIVGCSALKKSYRDLLRDKSNSRLIFIYMKGSRELIAGRMAERTGHFMPTSLLDSQFATLESPEGEQDVIVVDITATAEECAADALNQLSQL